MSVVDELKKALATFPQITSDPEELTRLQQRPTSRTPSSKRSPSSPMPHSGDDPVRRTDLRRSTFPFSLLTDYKTGTFGGVHAPVLVIARIPRGSPPAPGFTRQCLAPSGLLRRIPPLVL